MWDISVINKGKKWVDLEVVLDHPDAGSFPEDPAFALALLTDKAYGFDADYNYIATSPLGEAIPHDHSYLPETLSPIAGDFIERTVIYEAHNLPFDESEAHEKVNEQVRALGIAEDDDEWDGEWEDLWRDFWASKDNLPWARYRIWVTDEKWIGHMEIGADFTTASFSESGPWVNEDRMIELEEESDAEGRKGVPGFKHSEVPPHENIMDAKMIRQMAEHSDAFTPEEVREMLAEHAKFLQSGGSGGQFERLHVAGMPLNIYTYASGEEGKQLEVRMKKFAPGTDLSGADLSYADLSGAIFENVNLSGANLDGAILTDAFFANANFEGASAKKVDFTGGDFTNASFRNANLSEADFEIANCRIVDFTGANLNGTTFKAADLEGIKC